MLQKMFQTMSSHALAQTMSSLHGLTQTMLQTRVKLAWTGANDVAEDVKDCPFMDGH